MSEKAAEASSETKAPVEPASPDSIAPPPMPKRPISPTEKAIKDLTDAFPTVEDKYVKMALIASQGNLESAFNSLLYISDPESNIPIPKPLSASAASSLEAERESRRRRQEEADNALAHELAREYDRGSGSGSRQAHRTRSAHDSSNIPSWARDDDQKDDQMDELYDTISKNVENVRTKLNGWVGNLAKKINAAEIQGFDNGARQQQQRQRPRRQDSQNSHHYRDDPQPQLFSAFGQNKRDEDVPPPPLPPKSPIKMQDLSSDKLGEDTAKKPEVPAKKTEWKDLSTVQPVPMSDNDKFLVDDSEEEENEKKK